MKKNINKRFVLTLIGVLILISLFFGLRFFLNKKSTPIPPFNNNQAEYKKLIPGKSTKEDVISILGKPLNESSSAIEFKSLSPNRNNQIGIEQGKVGLIKEIVTLKDSTKIEDITKLYGLPQKVYYGPDAEAGFYLFVYPQNGIAYIGHPESGILLEIWYFPPTDLINFKEKYASDYTDSYVPNPDSPI